jgi:hypothetical protein
MDSFQFLKEMNSALRSNGCCHDTIVSNGSNLHVVNNVAPSSENCLFSLTVSNMEHPVYPTCLLKREYIIVGGIVAAGRLRLIGRIIRKSSCFGRESL